MSHELLLWLHVLTFALWFGTDLGVFTASLATTDPKQSVAVAACRTPAAISPYSPAPCS